MTEQPQPTSDWANDPRQNGRRRRRLAAPIHRISQARFERERRRRQAMVGGWAATRQYMLDELKTTGKRLALMFLLFLLVLAGTAAWSALKSFAGS